MIKVTSGGATTATTSQITYTITEKLCKSYCVNTGMQPIITKTWSVADTETVNSITYFTLQCVVGVTYQPKGSCKTCGQKTNTFVEDIVVSFPGTGTITYVDSNGYTEPEYTNSCCSVAHGVSNVGNISITFTEA